MKIKAADENGSSPKKRYGESVSGILVPPSGNKTSVYRVIIIFLLLIIVAGSVVVLAVVTDPGREIAKSVLYTIDIPPVKLTHILNGIRCENIRIPAHLVQGLMTNPEHISLDISNNDFQILSQQRDTALARGVWDGTDQYVPATIRYQGETIKTEMRIKGNSIEHWGTDEWSLKVKTRGDDRFLGMREFSLQKPETRIYLTEWVFHRLLAYENVPYLQFSYVDVALNGRDMGIYAVEETPDNRLLDSKGYLPGPVFHLDEGIWDARAAGYQNPETVGVNPFILYNEGRYSSGPESWEEARKASDLIEAYRDGSASANETFDLPSLARYFAILDLTGSTNARGATNIRPYYNPVTSRFELIGHDALYTKITEIIYSRQSGLPDQFFIPLFRDPEFARLYVQELERISDPAYLDTFFSAIGPDFEQNLSIIYKENPFYHFPRSEIYENNQKTIRQTIYPFRCEYSYLQNAGTNGTVTLQSISAQPMPVEILGLRLNGMQLPRTGGPAILDGYNQGDAITYQTLSFRLPAGVDRVTAADNLTLDCRVYGTTPVRTEPVFPKALFSDWPPGEDIVRQSPNTEQFSWLIRDGKNRTITIMPGKWEIGRDLIIPAGYTVSSPNGGGTRLDLTHGAMMLSFSPLRLQGDETLPFEVTSSDGSGQGILILNAENASVLSYVRISNLSVPDRNGWKVPSSVTFYQSPVIIDHAEFIGGPVNGSLLSIVRSDTAISGSRFMESRGDLVTVSYARLEVSDSQFMGPAAGGITGTGSIVRISGSGFEGPLGIGIRGMRVSTITTDSSILSGARISGAAEDGSNLTMTDSRILSGIIGLAAYQNTPGYGPGTVIANNVQITDTRTPYLSEKGSIVMAGSSAVASSGNRIFPQISEIAGISS
jgi:hypothetical protein